MKKPVIAILFVVFSLVAFPQDILWSEVESGLGLQSGYYVETDSEGNVYVGASGTNQEVYIIKYDSEGNQLMVVANYSAVSINGMALGSNGKIYWIGQVDDGTGHYDAIISVINPDGSTHFSQTFDDDGGSDFFIDLKVDESGAVYVLGNTVHSSTQIVPVTVKYKADGTIEWLQQFGASNPNFWYNGYKIEVDTYGNVYSVCVHYQMTSPVQRVCIANYDPNGLPQPTVVTLSIDEGSPLVKSTVMDDNDNLYIAGHYGFLSESTSYLTKVSDGEVAWNKEISSTEGVARIFSACLDQNDNIVIAGYNNEQGGNGIIYSYSPAGESLFMTNYNGLGYGSEWLIKIVSSDAHYYLTGFSNGIGTGQDMLALCLNGLGQVAWEASFNGFDNGSDIGYDICVDKDENVIITGHTASQPSNYCATVKYSNPLSVSEQTNHSNLFEVYPNPADNVLNLKIPDEINSLEVVLLDLSGRVVKTTSQKTIDVSSLPAGVYLLKVTQEKEIINLKFLKQ